MVDKILQFNFMETTYFKRRAFILEDYRILPDISFQQNFEKITFSCIFTRCTTTRYAYNKKNLLVNI